MALVGAGTLSAVGWGALPVGSAPLAPAVLLAPGCWGLPLPPACDAFLTDLARQDNRLRRVDRTVLLAVAAAKAAVQQADWLVQLTDAQGGMLINVGSSRGATGVWEAQHDAFTRNERLSPFASPLSTTGNVASWVGQRLLALGLAADQQAAFSHSITCSSALFAVANGVAWLRAGMVARALVGGAEAPLTPFTVAQMQALGVYAPVDHPEVAWPPAPGQPLCQPFGTAKYDADIDTLLLGEGAALFALQPEGATPTPALAYIAGVGWATEAIPSAAGLLAEGHTLHGAMRGALQMASLWDNAHNRAQPDAVQAVVAHAPGTRGGDAAELAALHAVFGADLPHVLSTKWYTGHTLGAAGGLGMALALELLQGHAPPVYPYPVQDDIWRSAVSGGPVRRVLVNAVGFGGTACSVLLEGAS